MQTRIGWSSKAPTNSLIWHEEAAVGVDRLAGGKAALHLACHVGLAASVAPIEDNQSAVQGFDKSGKLVRFIIDPTMQRLLLAQSSTINAGTSSAAQG